MKVKVILLDNVSNLGDRDDVVEVAEGYARNFLVPKKLAALATQEELKVLEERKTRAVRAAETELHAIQKLAEQLDGFEVSIPVKVSDAGTLYAAVTAKRVAEALGAKGFTVDPLWIILPEPIKTEGEFDTQLDLPHGLESTIKIIIHGE